MRLHIDWTLCDGRGLCVELLPEVLTEDDWGYPAAYAGDGNDSGNGNDITLPRDIVAHAQRAIAQCPRSALRMTR